MMKKAFTLVELLVVVVVIGIMLGMIVRFGNISIDQERHATTVTRMQRLENALSGYYAAFGTYPPVKLHNSRNYLLKVSSHGVQNTDGEENENIWGWCDSNGKVTDGKAEDKAWQQIQPACEAQPVGCYFPYEDEDVFRTIVNSYSETMKSYASNIEDADRRAVLEAGFDTGVPIGRFGSYKDKVEWSEIQLFQFGVLSYLLPRYLFMMEGPEELLKYAQWTGNNNMPSDPLTGQEYIGGWRQMRENASDLKNGGALARVANIPSQAICSRWMSNFEGALSCTKSMKLFGIDVKGDIDEGGMNMEESAELNTNIKIFSPGGYNDDSKSGQYILNSVTIKDGWRNEFYYYSPAPYQSYVVWSAGRNGRTFPPWVSRKNLGADANRCIGYWTSDDIVGLSK